MSVILVICLSVCMYVCLYSCVCVCRSESATLNIAVNRSLPLPAPQSSPPGSTEFFSRELLVLATLVVACCLLLVLCVSACALCRRRRASRDPEMTSHRDKPTPLCANGKVATIYTSSSTTAAGDKCDNNGHVRINRSIFSLYTCPN